MIERRVIGLDQVAPFGDAMLRNRGVRCRTRVRMGPCAAAGRAVGCMDTEQPDGKAWAPIELGQRGNEEGFVRAGFPSPPM